MDWFPSDASYGRAILSLLDDGWAWTGGKSSLRKEYTCGVLMSPNLYRLDIVPYGLVIERYDPNNVAPMTYKERIYIPTSSMNEAASIANSIIASKPEGASW